MYFKYLIVLFLISLISSVLPLHATEQKVVIKEYTYHAGEADSKQSARWSALEKKLDSLEKDDGVVAELKRNVLRITSEYNRCKFCQLNMIRGGACEKANCGHYFIDDSKCRFC
jgi:hypothetical protein